MTRFVRMSTLMAVSLVAFGSSATVCFAQEQPPEPKPVADKHELFHKYVESSLGPEGVFSAALSAAFDQLRNSPNDWGGGSVGYSKRWASDYAESAIGDTTKYAVARLLHQDPSYQRCQCTGFGPRLGHAVSSVFKARNREGEWVLSPAVAAGIVTSNVIPAATWYPYDHGVHDGLKHAGTSLGSKIGVRVFREFVHIPKIFQ